MISLQRDVSVDLDDDIWQRLELGEPDVEGAHDRAASLERAAVARDDTDPWMPGKQAYERKRLVGGAVIHDDPGGWFGHLRHETRGESP